MTRHYKIVDHIMLTILILALFFTTHFVSYELGRANQCNRDPGFRYSYDFGACIKMNKGDMR
jgi:hypothetical protein